jgi:hypothetical protein
VPGAIAVSRSGWVTQAPSVRMLMDTPPHRLCRLHDGN